MTSRTGAFVIVFAVLFALPASSQTEAARPAPSAQSANSSDTALIKFDSKGVDFAPWVRGFVQRVKRHWFISASLVGREVGTVELTFDVKRDGTIANVKITRASASPLFDKSAFEALARANPVQPLPDNYPEDHIFFTVIFFKDAAVPDAMKSPQLLNPEASITDRPATSAHAVDSPLIDDPRSVTNSTPAAEVFTIEGGTIYHRHNCASLVGHRKVRVADRSQKPLNRGTACHICLPDGQGAVEKRAARPR